MSLVSLVLGVADASGARAPLDKPNVVMLFVDDLGYGDTGFTGHPTTQTPALDALAFGGKVLTSWYSACPVCSCSRASLLTGRQWARMGIPGVFGPTTDSGLPLNETTVAEQLRKVGYASAAVGKWHVGQREAYLPLARGFDEYLGIPYSVDMGRARATPCQRQRAGRGTSPAFGSPPPRADAPSTPSRRSALVDAYAPYVAARIAPPLQPWELSDPAADFLPLVSQRRERDGSVSTTVVEQPLDLSTLGDKYAAFANDFIDEHAGRPFFLYLPFSHVHATAPNQPHEQYAGCAEANRTRRGAFGDALAEVDAIASAVVEALRRNGLERNTLVLFTGDNGPDRYKNTSGGSTGHFAGRWAGYWNTGKGSTWEGGVREAGFAFWPGVVAPHTRTAEIVSTMDIFPTLLALAGVPLPADRVYDGRDMTSLLVDERGRSRHEFLFFYGGAAGRSRPSAARWGPYKAHWATGPGIGGCTHPPLEPAGCPRIFYEPSAPLVFNVDEDPSEEHPLAFGNETRPADPAIEAVVAQFSAAYAREVGTFRVYPSPPAPDGPGEGPGRYGVCCNRTLGCDCDGPPRL